MLTPSRLVLVEDQPAPAAPRIRVDGAHQPGFMVRALAGASGRAAGTEPSKVFLTLGRNRKVFWSWLRFAATLMPGGRLPRRHTELVIVRVAALTGNAYELQAHLRLAREVGLNEDELRGLQDVSTVDGWRGRERLLVQVADEMHRERDLCDATWERVREQFNESEAIELVMLVAHYEMLATALRTLRVDPDPTAEA